MADVFDQIQPTAPAKPAGDIFDQIAAPKPAAPAAQPAQPDTFMRGLREVPALAAGVLGIPGDVANVGASALGYGEPFAGTKRLESMMGVPEPETAAQRVRVRTLENIGAFTVPVGGGVADAARAAITMAPASAVGGEVAGTLAEGTPYEGLARFGGELAGGLAAGVATEAASRALQRRPVGDVFDQIAPSAPTTTPPGAAPAPGLTAKEVTALKRQGYTDDLIAQMNAQIQQQAAVAPADRLAPTTTYRPQPAPAAPESGTAQGINPPPIVAPEAPQAVSRVSQADAGKADRVARVLEAVKAAEPVRASQEAGYRAARRAKLSDLLKARAQTSGEESVVAELRAIGGELPKVEFESLRPTVSQADIDGLFDDITASPAIREWEKLRAKIGLRKLFGEEGGMVPQQSELKLLHSVFGPEFVDAVAAKERTGSKILAGIGDVAGLMKSMMASFDLSAFLRQGAFLVGRPKQWGPAVKSMVQQFASEDAFNAVRTEIHQRPTYPLMEKAKLSLSDMTGSMSMREERFASRIAESIPGIRASDRAYTGFLNKMRADVFDDILARYPGSISPNRCNAA